METHQAQLPIQQQLQADGQQHAALMQSLMQAAAAGMGQPLPPMMQMGMGRPQGIPGQPGLPLQQVSRCCDPLLDSKQR
jgi:hypothetical protein